MSDATLGTWRLLKEWPLVSPQPEGNRMTKQAHDLRRGSTIVVYVDGEEGVRGYFGTALGHDGQFTVTKAKVTSGENYAQQPDGSYFVANGVNYVHALPHGDETQGGTWVWPDEVPAGFYVG